jgi:hypothetical protein
MDAATGGNTCVDSDMWAANTGTTQTLTASSPENWSVVANAGPAGYAGVQTYPRPPRSASQAHRGTHSLEIDSGAAFWAVSDAGHRQASVTPGKDDLLTGWLKSASGSEKFTVTINWLDGNGSTVGTAQTPAGHARQALDSPVMACWTAYRPCPRKLARNRKCSLLTAENEIWQIWNRESAGATVVPR